ncbi:hypothetical protein WJX73_003427 [Symbiochloris irregularis]|uniref:Uncharacterized protein n=1 Tax=Symbiochloris irregularis TaxID=706552 RepID=A0AAW1P277_9CHLO
MLLPGLGTPHQARQCCQALDASPCQGRSRAQRRALARSAVSASSPVINSPAPDAAQLSNAANGAPALEAESATGFDIITGQRVASVSAPEAAHDSSGGASAFISDLERTQREAATLQARLDTPVNARLQPEELQFLMAARALQKRLVMATRAEMEASQIDMENIYKRKVTQALKESGRLLLDMSAQRDGSLYGSPVWRFHTGRRPQGGGDLPAEGGEGQAGAQEADELPYHRFSHRDALLLSYLAGYDAIGDPIYVAIDSQPGTVLDVRKNYIRLAVSLPVSEVLEVQGAGKQWRMDFCNQTSTYDRQIQAISQLDRPWGATLEHQAAMEDWREERRGSGGVAPPAQPSLEATAGLWLPGERRVRKILLGHPDSAALAAQPPAWLSQERFRQLRDHVLKKDGLNQSQRNAIALALRSTFTLWQGPPGTGKTRTIHALVEALATVFTAAEQAQRGPRSRQRASTLLRQGKGRGQRQEAAQRPKPGWVGLEDAPALIPPERMLGQILVCSDTNAATDNIVEGLVAAGINVVRIGQPAKVREEIRSATLEARARETPQGEEGVSFQEMANQALGELRKEEGAVDWKALSEQDKAARKRAKQQAMDLYSKGTTLVEKAHAQVMDRCQVVAATLAGAGDMKTLTSRTFKVVVLDEASQATEPSSIIPLMRGAECVVMAGDPQQLPPTVLTVTGMECDLDRTVFDRLQASRLQPTLLDTQYRMHPQIAEFPSQLFYQGRIQTGITAADRPLPKGLPWPNPQCPVVMVECEDGLEERSATGANASDGASFFNEAEAKLAVRAAQALLDASDSKTAAILTPYNAQLRLINGLLKQVGRRHQVTVSTVDGYQGREADVVVFSAVRCNLDGRIGFVSDPRRLNVAITRPRRGLVVVGSPSTLASDPNWRAWIAWVRDHGCFLSADALPHSALEEDESLVERARKQMSVRRRAHGVSSHHRRVRA